MRLKEKEITDRREIEEILKKEKICYLAMADGDTPYVIPTTYGFGEGHIFMHSSKEGRKMEVIRKNNKVCVTVHTDSQLVSGGKGTGCKSTIKFRSVVATGRAKFLEKGDEKKKAMDVIMSQQFGESGFQYTDQGITDMAIIRIDLDSVTGKKSGY